MNPGDVEQWPVVCATGHRPKYLDRDQQAWVRDELARTIARLAQHHGTHTAISGMALGVDTWWAWSALDAGLDLWAYVPFPQQAQRWQPEQREAWARMLEQAKRLRQFGIRYDVGHLLARNIGMVRDSATTVAVWRPTIRHGGTWHAVNEALRLGKPVLHLDPDTCTVGRLTELPAMEVTR